MNKKYLFLFFLILISSTFFVNAEKISISPLRMTIDKLPSGTEKCEYLFINPDEKTNLEIAWAKEYSTNPLDYTLSSEEEYIDYEIVQVEEGKYSICLTPTYGGDYYGIIKITPENSILGICAQIKLTVIGDKKTVLTTFTKTISLTGNAIKKIDNSKQIGLATIFISLLILLLFTIKKYQNKKLLSSS